MWTLQDWIDFFITKMPSYLLEVEFFTNKDKVINLFDDGYRKKIVDSIYSSILRIDNDK